MLASVESVISNFLSPKAVLVNHIRVDLDRSLATIDRNIFGGFVEHLGRSIYGGIDEPDSPLGEIVRRVSLLAEQAGQLIDSLGIHWNVGNLTNNFADYIATLHAVKRSETKALETHILLGGTATSAARFRPISSMARISRPKIRLITLIPSVFPRWVCKQKGRNSLIYLSLTQSWWSPVPLTK